MLLAILNGMNEKNSPLCSPIFRLWLTSYSSQDFPTSLLQAGVKITIQRDTGLKANLATVYHSDLVKDEGFYSGGKAGPVFQRLLYSLCYFHGVVEERCQYGPIGWNVPYEFNISDFDISARQLRLLTGEGGRPPYQALSYLTVRLYRLSIHEPSGCRKVGLQTFSLH